MKIMKEKIQGKKNVRGITLIALAVTIVVILILAGVTIDAVFSENGIINKAKEAANSMNNAVANDQAELNDLLEELNEIMNSQWSNENTNNEENEIPEPEPEPEPQAPIPDGFYHVGGSIEEGFVISDNPEDEGKGTSHEVAQTLKGNQFVWIPVENMDEFIRYSNYSNSVLEDISSNSEPYVSGYSGEADEYNAMRASVETNKGFYIARYEGGTENGKLVSKQGKTINYIKWGDSMSSIGSDGAVVKAKGMYTDKSEYAVTSTLCYGVQWDAIMAFIDPAYKTGTCDTTTSFVANSEGKGNYNETANKNSWKNTLTITGASKDYSIKNIYDLGGNALEWTMEASVRTNVVTSIYRVARGAYYTREGRVLPASSRFYMSPNTENLCAIRVALYL